MSLAKHFAQMAKNNAWSNVRIYRACLQLSPEELTQTRVSFFPSLLATLGHVWIVDEYYVDALEQAGRGASIWNDENKHTELSSLWTAQQSVDRRLWSFCAKATDETLTHSVTLARRHGPQSEVIADVLSHLFVHQIHHRGQVHAMLSGTRIAPPQLDEWFLANDRTSAEEELAGIHAF